MMRVSAKITFTGSTKVGKMLVGGSGSQLKRLSLELGGHAPFIVCSDADPIHAAKGLALVKFLNSGQACISPNRIYVHEQQEKAFLEELTSRVSKLKSGPGINKDSTIVPLINEEALETVDQQVRDGDGLLKMANETLYGLASYVYTQNLGLAMKLFEGLNFGIVGINDINPTSAAAPFGGKKESGIGREGASEGIHEYLEIKLGGISI